MYAYLGALVFGGVLLFSSILLGGHDDGDFDADGDVDLDADLDVDADADLDLDVDGDVDADVDHGGGLSKDLQLDGGGADVFWALRSLRFWTFFLAFFGLTGMVLDGLGLVDNPWVTLALALGMGGATGFGAAAAIRALSSDRTAEGAGSGDYIGKTARVVVPLRGGSVGKVRVEVKGSLVDVLAVTDEGELTSEDEVLIIEMEGTRARVARIDD
ncbi:MAG TPA: NfeD family protein [Polyangiaceae bacterium LLY-WYZ-15_(1-7)]|nr:hypothetical protein [Myxococcales bacterium]MAT26914.1 hypothetical protein [Sandaracinus sp.]HJK89928.1 NfeD family protein [Polyangiaceae bacterium LLY-WYZ-15_(1-7)]MBJ70203.1 hypothetical protein [Sandaracinus sp.]HJL03117.1 NfeD family protein [Polyangiaceae bacterium LLY-WYZ-15_(1-7)]